MVPVEEMGRDDLIAESLRRSFPIRGRRPKYEARVEDDLANMGMGELRKKVRSQRYAEGLRTRSEPARFSWGRRGLGS